MEEELIALVPTIVELAVEVEMAEVAEEVLENACACVEGGEGEAGRKEASLANMGNEYGPGSFSFSFALSFAAGPALPPSSPCTSCTCTPLFAGIAPLFLFLALFSCPPSPAPAPASTSPSASSGAGVLEAPRSDANLGTVAVPVLAHSGTLYFVRGGGAAVA